jgi:hypothetical protein
MNFLNSNTNKNNTEDNLQTSGFIFSGLRSGLHDGMPNNDQYYFSHNQSNNFEHQPRDVDVNNATNEVRSI